MNLKIIWFPIYLSSVSKKRIHQCIKGNLSKMTQNLIWNAKVYPKLNQMQTNPKC